MTHPENLEGVTDVVECVRIDLPDPVFGQVEDGDGRHGCEGILFQTIDTGVHQAAKLKNFVSISGKIPPKNSRGKIPTRVKKMYFPEMLGRGEGMCL